MSKKIARKDRHFKFETLQLHVGCCCAWSFADGNAVWKTVF